MTNLRKAINDGKIDSFIKQQEPLEAPKASVQRYIDASATPLESSKEGQSKFYQGSGGDCK